MTGKPKLFWTRTCDHGVDIAPSHQNHQSLRLTRIAIMSGVLSLFCLTPINDSRAQSLSARNQAVSDAIASQPRGAAPGAGAALTPDALAALNRQISLQARNQLAIDAMRAAQDRARNLAIQSNAPLRPGLAAVPNGLVTGGLDPNVVEADVLAGRSRTDTAATQLKVWQGAKFPTTGVKADGSAGTANDVNVDITADRAILSWASFNVGKETTLTFKPAAQFEDAGNKGWVALNRIVGGLNPDGTRNGAGPAPSQILGKVQVTDAKGNASKGTGTLLVLNQNGIIFGGSSQINVSTLIASTADVGTAATYYQNGVGSPEQFPFLTRPRYLAERNSDFMKNGLLGERERLGVILPANFSDFSPYVSANTTLAATTEGKPSTGIFVDAGSVIRTTGGAIILNSLDVENAGSILVQNGNVSLVSSLGMSLPASTGESPSLIRGLVGVPRVSLNVNQFAPGEVRSINTGIIEAQGGAIIVSENGIGTLTGDDGRPKNFGGILLSSTSVSRNGSIAVERSLGSYNPRTGLRTDAANASLIQIMPDTALTIPQDATSLSNFKQSRVDIGYYLGENATVYAPGGTVTVDETPVVVPFGILTGTELYNRANRYFLPSGKGGVMPSFIDPATGGLASYDLVIEARATIDVSGLKVVVVPASRNSIKIGPLKGNELANSPQYRTGFLNGATVYVDPRLSGVRSDGVAWIGSPLIDAASYVQQVGVSAAELSTKGGSVTINGLPRVPNTGAVTSGTPQSNSIVRNGATIDVSGGWRTFEAGQITTTQLRGADGRTYDIGEADPLKTRFTGFAGGFTVDHTKWGLTETFASPLGGNTSLRFVDGYIEGRDAGTLALGSASVRDSDGNPIGSGAPIAFDAALFGKSYAGIQQLARSQPGASVSGSWDKRLVQGASAQLPVNGGFRIDYGFDDSAIPRGLKRFDIVAGDPSRTAARASGVGQIALSPQTLNNAGLSQISISNEGRFTVTDDAALKLAPGGVFDVIAGRAITINGSVTAEGGQIALETVPTPTYYETYRRSPSGTPTGINIVRTAVGPGDFDVTVDGRLSVRGRFVNDFAKSGHGVDGNAFLDAGKISLVGAPSVAAPKTIIQTRDIFGNLNDTVIDTTDISGSILVNKSRLGDNVATLNLNGGARIGIDGKLSGTGKGGSLSVVNMTAYFKVGDERFPTGSAPPIGVRPSQRLALNASGISRDGEYVYALPDRINAKVVIDPKARIDSFGFGGGGTFELVTPEFEFVDRSVYEAQGVPANGFGTRLAKDFIERNGFQNYNITSYKTTLVRNDFVYDGRPLGNPGGPIGRYGYGGYHGFLDTQTVTIGAGETFTLRNKVLSALFDPEGVNALRSLASGGDILWALTPTTLAETKDREDNYAFYRNPVNLTFGGLIELKVAAGGTITGEAGATLGVVKLLNEGTITLPSGTIAQSQFLTGSKPLPTLPDGRTPRSIADIAAYYGGARDARGYYLENAGSLIRDPATGVFLSNGELLYDRYIGGDFPPDAGIVLAAGSTTNLKGATLRDPLAQVIIGGAPTALQAGRILAGGKITMAQAPNPIEKSKAPDIFSRVSVGRNIYSAISAVAPSGQVLIAQPGSAIDISGTNDAYDVRDASSDGALNGRTGYTRVPVWSSAGSISAPNGAAFTGTGTYNGVTYKGATLSARGGDLRAQGGTLDILNPILVASNTAQARANVVAGDFLQSSGIDVLIARGGLSAEGTVDLALGRALSVIPRFATTSPATSDPIYYPVIRGTAGSNLTIRAPYVRIESSADTTLISPAAQGTSTIALIADGGSERPGTFDISGSVLFDNAFAGCSVRLESTGDLRLSGIAGNGTNTAATATPTLQGGLYTDGALTLKSRRTYATTGSDFTIRSGVRATIGSTNGSITFERPANRLGLSEETPYSAGSRLSIYANAIIQGGALFAPHGTLRLGSVDAPSGTQAPLTQSLVLASGSLTSVSGGTISIPYGTTTDLKEWFFLPAISDALTVPPSKTLALLGTNITVQANAAVDLKGGGDVFAYEFVPGTGGSRDVLNRLNPDIFTNNAYTANGKRYAGSDGGLYPDGRQVYAIVPGLSDASVAAYDPIFSRNDGRPGNYGELYSSASQTGRRVYLNEGAGVPAGWYTLLPAQYAVLPGGIRVVERTGATALPGQGVGTLADGTKVVTGYYGQFGTQESTLRLLDVQSQDVFRQYSRIETTSGNTYFPASAEKSGSTSARQLADAASISIAAGNSLSVLSAFDTRALKGRGALADIGGNAIRVVSPGGTGTGAPGEIVLDAGSLNRLSAESLLLGGARAFNADGSTTIVPSFATSTITIANDAANPLQAPELLLAAGGSITLAPQASLVATGSVSDATTADYVVKVPILRSTGQPVLDSNQNPTFTSSALLRVANGPQRLTRDVPLSGSIAIGARATVSGTSVLTTIGARQSLTVDPTVNLNVTNLALNAGGVAFGETTPAGFGGLLINRQFSDTLARAQRLTISSDSGVSFEKVLDRNGSEIARQFGDLTLLTPLLTAATNDNVNLNVARLTLGNRGATAAACTTACLGSLTVNVTGGGTGSSAIPGELIFGPGTVASGFAGEVRFTAMDGIFAQNGTGGLDVGASSLRLTTPVIADRRIVGGAQPRVQFKAGGAIAIERGTGQIAPNLAALTDYPGASLGFDGASVSVSGTRIRATAGTINAVARIGDVSIANGAIVEVPGYDATLGRTDIDPVTQSTVGGRIRLEAQKGALSIAKGTTVSVGGGTRDKPVGTAGVLELIAPNMASTAGVALSALNGFAKSENGGAGLTVNLAGGFDLPNFARVFAERGFTGALDITTRDSLMLQAGEILKATSLKLTSNGGGVTVEGTIDTHGLNGGNVGLYGNQGVTLGDNARILAYAEGYGYDAASNTWANTDTRKARAGDVTFGTEGAGRISVAAGAVVDVRALQSENRVARGLPTGRLVEIPRQDKSYYQYVEGDLGGSVKFRAPVQSETGLTTLNIAVANAGAQNQIRGARDVIFSGFRRFDLDAIATADAGRTIDGQLVKSVTITTDANGVRTASIDPRGQYFGYLTDPTETNPAGTFLQGGLADFVQRFNVASSVTSQSANLGSGTALRKQPGVDLAFDGNITLSRSWNLAAGAILVARDASGRPVRSDLFNAPYQAATDTPEAKRLFSLRYNASATDKLAEKQAVEATVFSTLTSMLYRTGGSVRGEAPDLALRASGTLTTQGSISDGFFSFREQTAGIVVRGTRTQGNILSLYSPNANAVSPNDFGNTASATTYKAGDPFGSMELFPTLGGGVAAKSSSISLTAGAAVSGSGTNLVASANTASVLANPDAAFLARGTYVYNAQSPTVSTTLPLQTAVSPYIRTGSGNLSLGASGTIDLRGRDETRDGLLWLVGGSFNDATSYNVIGCPVLQQCTDFSGLGTSTPASGNFFPSGVNVPGGAKVYTAGIRAISPSSAVAERKNSDGSITRVDFALDMSTYTPTRTYVPQSIPPGIWNNYRVQFLDPIFATDGGSVYVNSGRDLLERMTYGSKTRQTGDNSIGIFYGMGFDPTREPWRDAEIRNAPLLPGYNVLTQPSAYAPVYSLAFNKFKDGIGSFGGGSISVNASGAITDLRIVQTSSAITADAVSTTPGVPWTTRVMLGYGGGNASVASGGDFVGGQFDVKSGIGTLLSRGSIAPSALNIDFTIRTTPTVVKRTLAVSRNLDIGITDADIRVSAADSVNIGYIETGTVNVGKGALALRAGNAISVRNNYKVDNTIEGGYPGSFEATALLGDLTFGSNNNLFPGKSISLAPSANGSLKLFAGGTISPVSIDLSDTARDNYPDIFNATDPNGTGIFPFPDNSPGASQAVLRSQHAPIPTHLADPFPVRVNAGVDIVGMLLNAPKETRIEAGRDIVDMAFFGQNLRASDVTRVAAARNILATTRAVSAEGVQRPAVQGNTFYIGGPGEFVLEAGRDAGPFLNSAIAGTVAVDIGGSKTGPRLFDGKRALGGGILAVGNALNPFLPEQSASVSVRFGVGKGVAWNEFREAYLNPANTALLSADFFRPKASGSREYIYAERLIAWVKANAPDAFARATGASDYQRAYNAFASLPILRQETLLQQVYYAELAATSDTSYARGYQAVNTLFPADMSADGQYGYTRNALSGGSNGANELVHTGDLDLRLATIQTQFGGDVNILGPGGRLLGGSVVRTSDQIARRSFDGLRLFSLNAFAKAYTGFERSYAFKPRVIEGIPTDLEGILTLRSGNINVFTDTDLLLNASRIATRSSGNIFLWSSNADLNAGEGPKTSANYPPVVVACTYNGYCPQNPGGAITGAGIATYPPDDADLRPGDVTLRAGRGTIDAGAAGVRVAGNLSIAALRVLNADNFQVKGTSTGLPAVSTPNLGALENAGNVTGAAVKEAASETRKGNDRPSIIIVEIVGFGGDGTPGDTLGDCPAGLPRVDGRCPVQPKPTRQGASAAPGYNAQGTVQIIGVGPLDNLQQQSLTEEERRSL